MSSANLGRLRSASVGTDSDVISGAVIKDGWLYISRKRNVARFERKYCFLNEDGNSLCFAKSVKETSRAKKITLILSQISSIEVKGHKFTFQIVSRDETTIIKAESAEELEEWVFILKQKAESLLNLQIEDANTAEAAKVVIADAIPPDSAYKENTGPDHDPVSVFLQKNDYCTDCSHILSEGYQGHIAAAFVSLKIGCVLCEQCALCHYDILGNECSDVHSMQPHATLPQFDAKQDPIALSFIGYMGNKKANNYWEAKVGGYTKPTTNSSKKERSLWIKEKYLQKTFRSQKRGELTVKDKKKTKKCWIVLELTSINIFNSKDDQKAQDIIVLQSCRSRLSDEVGVFLMITPGKTYKLDAGSGPEAMEWVNAISIAAASIIKQITNTSSIGNSAGMNRLIVPTTMEAGGSGSEKGHCPLFRYQIASDHSERGRTFTSILQLEEQIQTLQESNNAFSATQIAQRIAELKNQQRGYANLLWSLPVNEFQSSLVYLVKDPSAGFVRGGPVEALIEYLVTTNLQDDVNFAYSWMLTYRSFSTPGIFLCELSKHFNRNDRAIQEHICHFLESWICSHFYDWKEDGDALEMLLGFLDKTVAKGGWEAEANRLRTMMRNQMVASLVPSRVLLDTAPSPIVPAQKELDFLSLADLDDLEIARQLALMDQKLFFAIKPREFLNRAWMGSNATNEAPNIARFQERYNKVVHWVLTTINKLDKHKRSFMLCKFIQIAKHSKDLRNYTACTEIMAAIEHTIMTMFEGTWESIPQKYVPILLDLRKLVGKSAKYNNLKATLYSHVGPCVPHLQIYLDEINEIYKSNANYLDSVSNPVSPKQINFEKQKKIARVVAELRTYQQATYILRSEPTVQWFLFDLPSFTPGELVPFAKLTHFREDALGLAEGAKDSNNKAVKPKIAPPSFKAPSFPTEEEKLEINLSNETVEEEKAE